MDLVIIALTLLPILMTTAFRWARRGRLAAHRNLQTITIALVLVAVVLFEADVRSSGGKAAFLAHNPSRAALVGAILQIHVAMATSTLIAWIALAATSWRRFHRSLPGDFSRLHRRLGRATFAGVCMLSLTGALIYLLVFVL